MPIQLTCPACQRQLRVPDNLVGQMVKCPGCKEAFKAVVEEAPPEPPPSRRPPDDDDRYRDEAPPPERRVSRRDDDDLDEGDDDRGERRSRRRSRRNLTPHRGTLILVLGILGLAGCGIFTAIPAWVMGNGDLKEIRAGRMDPEGESQTNIGRILGMVSTILTAVILLGYCFIFMILGIVGAAGGK